MSELRSIGTIPGAARARGTQRLETLAVAAAFVLLTALMTWPHVTVLATRAVGHQDIYFNLWRLRWIAHALIEQPLALFDGNIFHPEPLTLTYSDAILVEGIASAPLFWLGLPPVLVHNLALWGALVGSATGIFVLVRELTGSRAGAFASAIIFTFAPYRFDHYMHMELQWTMWIPWAFWALHRTLSAGALSRTPARFRLRQGFGETSPELEKRRRALAGTPAPRSAPSHTSAHKTRAGDPGAQARLGRLAGWESKRYGLLTGVFVALQMLSSIYYGVFLATLLPVVGILLLLAAKKPARRAAFRALIPGAILAALLCAAYAAPYLATKERVGGRGNDETHRFSARPSSYLIATPDNIVWGDTFAGRSRSERRLFPGALALVLAFGGLMLRQPSVLRMAYFLGAVAAFELSLGFSGYSFPFLREHVPVFEGLRAMARAGLFVLFFVAVLAGFGYAFLAGLFAPRTQKVLAAAVFLLLLGEYRVEPLALVRYPNEAPPLYAWLAQQPEGVVVELPMPVPEGLPGEDPRYSYLSTFHWNPMLNGYSGFHPASYLERADALRTFPSERAIARLQADGARYIVVHFDEFEPERRAAIRNRLLTRYGMSQLASFPGRDAESIVFAMQ